MSTGGNLFLSWTMRKNNGTGLKSSFVNDWASEQNAKRPTIWTTVSTGGVTLDQNLLINRSLGTT